MSLGLSYTVSEILSFIYQNLNTSRDCFPSVS